MTTLTAFLLARIAEDEEAQRSESGWGRCDAPESYHWGPARVLAECEAKRLIVEATWHLESHDFDAEAYRHIAGKQLQILHALALPYADHPDYREEWKP